MTAIIVILGIVGLIWGTILAVRGSLLPGCVIYLIAASCCGNHFFSVDAVGLTWTIERFVLFGLVAMYVVQWRLGKTDPKPLERADIVLGLFFGLLLFSTFTHDWRSMGPDEVPVFMHLVNGYLAPLALFFIARQAMLKAGSVRAVYWLLAGFGIYLAVTSLLEITGQWSLVFPRYIADSEIGIHYGRARGPMLQSARFGTYMVICMVATWIALAWLARNWRPGILLAIGLTPLYAAAAYFTYTRSVWLGMGLASAIVAALALRGRPRMFVLGSMAALALIVVAAKGSQLVAFKREYTASDTRKSTYMRASFAYVSWQMFQDKPLLGFGFGQFPRENRHYLGDRSTTLHLESIRGYVHHNTILSLLVELGILGPILFVGMLGCWCRAAWDLWRDSSAPDWVRAHGVFMLASMAPYVFQLIFRDVSYAPIENGIIFMMGGMAMGLRHATQSCGDSLSLRPRTNDLPSFSRSPAIR